MKTAKITITIELPLDEKVNKSVSNDYVDLGLPSGILWCKRNINAQGTDPENITGYGEYFNYDEAMRQENIPSQEYYNELLENTTQRVRTICGVTGMMFISKKDPTKFIFFPFAGLMISNGGITNLGRDFSTWLSGSYKPIFDDSSCMFHCTEYYEKEFTYQRKFFYTPLRQIMPAC